jgi:hypothetical protein
VLRFLADSDEHPDGESAEALIYKPRRNGPNGISPESGNRIAERNAIARRCVSGSGEQPVKVPAVSGWVRHRPMPPSQGSSDGTVSIVERMLRRLGRTQQLT